MRISDLKELDIKVGMRVKSLVYGVLGTITNISVENDRRAKIVWDTNINPSYFYGNVCQCEVVE